MTTSSVPVSIEWSDLDGNDTLDIEQAAPEVLIEDAPAHGRLEIEADERYHGGNTAAMLQHDVIVDVAERGQADKRGIVAERERELRLIECLRCWTADAGNHDRPLAVTAPLRHRSRGQAEDRLQQLDGRGPNLELRGVHADGEPSGARVAVIARQRDLTAIVELTRLGEGERMCRNHDATEKGTPHRQRDGRSQNLPSVTSKCVGLLRDAPPD